MVNIAVLVSGGGTNLQALIDNSPYEGGVLRLVLSSSPDAYALRRAEKSGIETCVLSPKEYDGRDAYTRAVVERLETSGIGLVVFGGFLVILSPAFSKAFDGRAINIHPSLIPSFCGDGFYGLRVHKAALEYGVKLTGATAHYVTAITDGGPIIAQKAIPVLPGDTPESLQKRVMEQCEWPLLTGAVRDHCAGKLRIENRRVIHT